MVVDLNKVTLGRKIEEGALTVVEQIPGLVVSSDQTQALRQGDSRPFFNFVSLYQHLCLSSQKQRATMTAQFI